MHVFAEDNEALINYLWIGRRVVFSRPVARRGLACVLLIGD